MTSSHAEYVDARQSSFNQTGRDWNQNTTNYYISFSLFGPQHQQTTGRVPNINDDLPRPISNRATSCHIVAPYRSSHTISTIDSAVKLIIQITDQLIDRRDSSNNYRELQSELKYLHQTLMLTRLAIQEYDGRPLGLGLANAITPEVVRCCIVLQEMLDSIVATCQGLSLTSINYLWRPVWQKRWDGEELAALRDKLSGSRNLFEEFLMGLHSVAWLELGNEFCAGPVSLRRFHYLFIQRLPFLGHIKLNAVHVVSHLGDIIPIPNMFCSTWKDFDYVIKGHCRNRLGSHIVEQGDYEIIRAENNQMIHPSKLAQTVESGMKLEMSIVIRQGTAFQETCPRCRHNNVNATEDHGWIQCRKCSGQFRIAEAELNYRSKGSDAQGDKERGRKISKRRSRESHAETADEEVISPASRRKGSITAASAHDGGARDDDSIHDDDSLHAVHNENSTPFFRRIHIICMNSVVGPSYITQTTYSDQVATPLELLRDKVIQEIDAAFNMPPHDHRRWRDVRDNMTFYPFVVHYGHEIFTMMRKQPELDTVEVSSLRREFLQHVHNWRGSDIIETIVDHAVTYEKMVTNLQRLIAIPDISPVVLQATPSVDWSGVLAMAMAYDIVDLTKAIWSQQQIILAASDDILLDIMDVLRSLIDRGCAEYRLLERFIEKIVRARRIWPRYLFLSPMCLTDELPFAGGPHADVYKGEYRGRKMALKVLRIFGRPEDRDRFYQKFYGEALVWRRLRHLNVLPFLGICADVFEPRLVMVSPYMENGNVNVYLKEYPNANRVQMIAGVASGLSYLHALKPQVIHSNLRGDNILVDNNHNPRIAGFSQLKVIDSQASDRMKPSSQISGDVRWLAPELLRINDGHPITPTAKSDTYAFACVCFEIFTGECPFREFGDGAVILQVLFHNRLPGKPTEHAIGRGLDSNMWRLMQDCWKSLPDDRPSMEVVLGRLTKSPAVNDHRILLPFSQGSNSEDDLDSPLASFEYDESVLGDTLPESDEEDKELRQVRAQYSYDRHNIGHLSPTEGMSLEVLDDRDPYWWLIRDIESGRHGIIPYEYLDLD